MRNPENDKTAQRRGPIRSLFSALEYSSESDSEADPLSRSIVGEPTERAVTSFSTFDRDDLWERTETAVPTLTNQPRQITPNPEHTETSYDTVPETKPESETETIEIDTNMVGESSRMRDDPMGEDLKKDDKTQPSEKLLWKKGRPEKIPATSKPVHGRQ